MAVRQSKISREKPAADGGKLGRELFGLFTVFCGLLVILSLATFDSRDPWLNHVVSGVTRVHNKAGLFGAYFAGFLYDMIGFASWTVPVFFCIAGARRILSMQDWAWWRWIGFMLLALCLSLAGAARDLDMDSFFASTPLPPGSGNVSAHGGGIVGHMAYTALVSWLSPTGTVMIWLFSLLLAVQMITGLSWLSLVMSVGTSLWEYFSGLARDTIEARNKAADERLELAADPAVKTTVQGPLPVTTHGSRSEHELQPETKRSGESGSVPLKLANDFGLENKQKEPGTPKSDTPRVTRPETSPAEPLLSSAGPVLLADPFDPFGSFPLAPETPDLAPEKLLTDNINVGVERPELFRETPLSVVRPVVTGIELPSRGTPEPLTQTPLAAVPSFLQTPLADEPPASQPASRHDDFLSLAPQPSGGRVFSYEDERDLPPWVRDFEEDRLGVQAGQSLSEPFRMPTAEASLNSETKRENSPELFLQDDEDTQPLHVPLVPETVTLSAAPETMPLPESARTASWDMVESEPSAFDKATDEEGAYSSEMPEPISGEPEDDAGLPSVLPWPEEAAFPAAPPVFPALHSSAESVTAERLPEDDDADAGYAGDIRIVERPEVALVAPSGLGSGLLNAAVRLIKKPVRAPLPPLDLLEAAPAAVGGMSRALLEAKGRSLMTCLNDFGIQGELVGITPGPVVTMFEVRPAPGVRVSRIANLSDDLALALKAVAVRIQAPVPGTDTVGIEIPNEVRETVCLKELLSSQLFQEAKSLLTLALGKDIAGAPAVADLATMPHLLVAGATGAGKSVGINSIILSLIYKARPEEVQLLLIDPKRVEMAIYANLPHLVHPVVTEMQLAKNALEWAVSEMERRYTAIAKAGVRNITDYNAKVSAFGNAPPPGLEDLEFMPYLVIVIDELADLMLVAAKEVETSIVRLAQLARAAGIHLILATQRPSVDVVTGLIKANFPCRISFQVTSKHDSRTILDTVGAEHLLGKGDMLFKPSGGKFRRMHGAFVSDQNVNAVVGYWCSQQKPDYQMDFSDWGPDNGSGLLTGNNGGGGGDIASDPIYNEAVEFVRQQGKASISLIQRKFRIGFNKAARFVEQMEQDGIIGPADGSRPRMVIR